MKLKQILLASSAFLFAQQSFSQSTIASNTLTGVEFLGSANAMPVIFKASGTEYMRMQSTGRIGIGATAPQAALHVQVTGTNDGIRISQAGTTAASLGLYNSSTGGHNYALFSTGSGNITEGPGLFGIYDYTVAAYRLSITGSNGFVGIGTGYSAPTAKLHVTHSYTSIASDNLCFFEAFRNVNGVSIGAKGQATTMLGGASAYAIGLYGNGLTDAALISTSANENVGVWGNAQDGSVNRGGYFQGTATSSGKSATGIYATYTATNGATGWAAYFVGSTYCTGTYQSSDLKLKENVKPLTGAVDKLKQLKPSTYTFKINEFKAMNLPEGLQMGLIAQDLEKVFPELVRDVKGSVEKNVNGEVTGTIPDFKSVNYTGLIPVLISAIQEQQKQLDEQKETIAELKQQQDALNSAKPVNAFTDVKLYQNEPNPFSKETTIRYNLPEQVNQAYIAVYDLSGKQLLTLPLSQKGAGAITVSSNKLSAGIYIYSIIADNKLIDSKRMVLTDN
ncbi:MAG: type sorting protein [Bacteroidetes bacterium]|nr:type sorting protein [Bacteroidota bacterium]